MGDLLSTPSTSPIDSTPNTTNMASSQTSQTLDSKPEETKTLDTQTPAHQSSDPPPAEQNETLENQERQNVEEGGVEGEEEEEGECGFCLFMKGGGCKDSFVAWEKCIEEAEKNKEDIVDKCFELTGKLKECMEAHPDYYGPILEAEKAVEEEAMRELEKEKAKEAAAEAEALGSKGSEQNSAEGS
ncbi:uncharacterized protein LOC132294836 [Cornus florida]|uniref:uncharacterized protein LOC132294836 n=1 Tax=Cornus florida TaxID=4283 RepID=UPI00289EC14C|nr:uncharacterized protein LOC132294836 [Cornus florida]